MMKWIAIPIFVALYWISGENVQESARKIVTFSGFLFVVAFLVLTMSKAHLAPPEAPPLEEEFDEIEREEERRRA
jgi:hypothetical protein